MQIYSKNSEAFLKGIKAKAKAILNQEMGLTYKTSRVHFNGYSFPLRFVVFESDHKLGYFDPNHFQLGLNKKLMYTAKTQVISDILRHELVDFYHHITSQKDEKPHGQEFKKLCDKFQFSEEVKKASSDLEILNHKLEGDLASEKLIQKVKKLYSLANSENIHERELATLKANQLLLKHNLNRFQLEMETHPEEEEACLKKILTAKKNTAKLKAIYEILETFFVQPVLNYGKGQLFLEVIGNRTNVELADYMGNFLDYELDFLWKENQKSDPSLKGIKAKNSFMKGLSKGYVEKIKSQHQEYAKKKDLITIKGDVERQVAIVYGRLGFGKVSQASTCSHSFAKGQKAGQELNMRKGLSNTKVSKRFIPFFGK